MSICHEDSFSILHTKNHFAACRCQSRGNDAGLFFIGLVIGTLDKEDMAHYVFSLLAEQAIDVEGVEVDGAERVGKRKRLEILLDLLLRPAFQ